MERLKEEEETEEDIGDEKVRYPEKGADYVVLPTSDKPQDAEEIKRKKRRKQMIITAAVIVLAVIVIVLCVLFLVVLKKKEEENEPEPVPDPLPDITDRITCNLAGLTPSKELCEESGCEFRTAESLDGSSRNRCVYPEDGFYTVEDKVVTSKSVHMTLKLGDKFNRRRRETDLEDDKTVGETEIQDSALYKTEGDKESVTSKDNALAVLPKSLYVDITNEGGRTLRIKVSASKQNNSDEDIGPPPSKRDLANNNFILKTAHHGRRFYVLITRVLPEGEEEVILDTRGQPLIVSEHLVHFTGVLGAAEIFSNGKSMESGDEMTIWNSQENADLPYFYGSVGKVNPRVFGVAMDTPAPMKISFGARKKAAQVVEFVQLGGDLNLLLFVGPSRRDLATQYVQTFGLPHRTPWWSLGTIVNHDENGPINSTSYKIDVLVLESPIEAPHSSQKIKAVITYVNPLVNIGNSNDPQILTAEGENFSGAITSDQFPGSFHPYVDYTHPYTDYDDQEESVYSVSRQGYNLRKNYPLNFADLSCQDNIINNSPFLDLSGHPLYNNTICLDYIHTGGNLKGASREHRLVHNEYGTLQANILHKYRTLEGRGFMQISDSVSLGAGRYTAKTIEISTGEDLIKVIPLITWYGNVGMHAKTRLAPGIKDAKMIKDYHKLNSFLLFTSGDEAALSLLDKSALAEIKEFVKTKYHLYPEWLTALHKSSETDGLPVIREMSFNFPGDPSLAGREAPLQYMVGDKIVVAAGVLLGKERSVYLPSANNETWYKRNQKSYQRVTPQNGTVAIQSDKDPSEVYFVRGNSVLMTSRLFDKFSGNPIEAVKVEYVEITIFLGKADEEIGETFYLREHDDMLLQVDVTVTSNSSGVRILLQPSGDYIDNDSSDERTWSRITIAPGGLQGRVSSITMNEKPLSQLSYVYDARKWETSPLNIIEDTNMESTPTLHKTYDIMISYIPG